MAQNGDIYRTLEEWSTKPRRDLAQPGTKLKLAELGTYTEIGIGEAAVREIPIVSYAFGHCKALLLSNPANSRVAHSHLLLKQDPSALLEYMISGMGCKPEELRGIAITDEQSSHIEEACRRHRIGNLQVEQMDGERLKDIIALPTPNQVLVYTAGETQPREFSF